MTSSFCVQPAYTYHTPTSELRSSLLDPILRRNLADDPRSPGYVAPYYIPTSTTATQVSPPTTTGTHYLIDTKLNAANPTFHALLATATPSDVPLGTPPQTLASAAVISGRRIRTKAAAAANGPYRFKADNKADTPKPSHTSDKPINFTKFRTRKRRQTKRSRKVIFHQLSLN